MWRSGSMLLALAAVLSGAAHAQSQGSVAAEVAVTEWKAVYGTVEARDRIPARARLGGTLVSLTVSEGETVEAGQELGRIVDDKLDFSLAALAARRDALSAQLLNAQTDLTRNEELLKNGVTTVQRVDAMRTAVDVLKGQIAALDAEAEIITQQAKEGIVLAPVGGIVLDVPVSEGAVAMPGEVIAVIGGGGTFLRIAVPERHAGALQAGDAIRLSEGTTGRLARVYPLIEGGRVVADVEVENLPATHIGARLLVRLPVGERRALLVPATVIVTRAGLDFVGLQTPDGVVLRSIVPGETHESDNGPMVEVISGLAAGDEVVPAVAAGGEASHD